MKKLLLSLAVIILLIAVFSTIDYHYERQMPSWGLWPVDAGDSGGTGAGAGSQMAEMTVRAEEPLEINTAATEETGEAPQESQADSGGINITVRQETSQGMTAVFLSGAAAMLIVELVAKLKEEPNE